MEHLNKYWPLYIKIVTTALGVGVVIHEVFVVDTTEPAALGFAALCLGLVAGVNLDKLRNKNGSDQ